VAAVVGILVGGCALEAQEALQGAAATDADDGTLPYAAHLDSEDLGAQADFGSAELDSAYVAPAESTSVATVTYAPLVLPAGTRILTKLNDYLDSGENSAGDSFTMSVAEDVYIGGDVAIRVGSQIRGYVASVESARRPNKGGRLVLKADSLQYNGKRVEFEAIVTADTEREGKSSIKEDWKEIAAGAGVGGLVGGLIGGGKGVFAGVLIGGGGTFMATKGEQIELPPDTELIVELREPVQVPS
jgi:hypothetical protein